MGASNCITYKFPLYSDASLKGSDKHIVGG